MKKTELDNYFTRNHKSITEYIKNCLFKFNKFNTDHQLFLSELYIYCEERKEQIKDCQELQKYISTFIFKNSGWKNTKIKENDSKLMLVEGLFDYSILDEEYKEYGLDLEELRYISNLYYQSLTNVSDRAIWEIYFIEGKTNIQDFADYIKLSKTVANKYIKNLKSELKDFYKQYLKEKQEKKYLQDVIEIKR